MCFVRPRAEGTMNEAVYFPLQVELPKMRFFNPGLESIVHCSLRVIIYCGSIAIPLTPITSGSANLPDSIIKEAVKP